MPATAKLLCMGLFSIFWVREPRRPCGWLAGPELAAAPAFAQVSFGFGVSFGAYENSRDLAARHNVHSMRSRDG